MTQNTTKESTLKAIKFHVAQELYPPSVREQIVADEELAARFDYEPVIRINFGGIGVSFLRNDLYAAVRHAIACEEETILAKDDNGSDWVVTASVQNDAIFISLANNENRLYLGDFFGFSPSADVRTSGLRRTVDEYNLEIDDYELYKSILELREFVDREHADYFARLRNTPFGVGASIVESLKGGSISLGLPFPATAKYYRYLAGEQPVGLSLTQFASQTLPRQVRRLTEWDSLEGLKFAVALGSSTKCVDAIANNSEIREQIVALTRWAVNQADVLSKLVTVELSIPLLQSHADISPNIVELMRQLANDDAEDPNGLYSRFSLLSTCTIGELARTGALRGAPPYFVKLCGFAQASLITRAILSSNMDVSPLMATLENSGAASEFYLRALVDLRSEPRWLPDFLSPGHMKQWFLGRVANAIQDSAQAIAGSVVEDAIKQEPLFKECYTALRIPLSGPLDGGLESESVVPEAVIEDIRKSLSVEILTANSFSQLANAALFAQVGPDLAKLAVDALRRVRFDLTTESDEEKDLVLLFGLAIVAAVSKSSDLADALEVLARVKRKTLNKRDAALDLRLMFMAAAAFAELTQWSDFVGKWLQNVALAIEDQEKARWLLLKLDRLVIFQPELMRSTTKARAMLRAVAKSGSS